jgi:hypothetical protein
VKLIDSSCWVEYYRADGNTRIQNAVEEAIESDEAATCGMILTARLLHHFAICIYN